MLMDIINNLFLGFLFVLGVTVGIVLGLAIEHVNWENNAVEHECGQYNNKTGDFEWIKK